MLICTKCGGDNPLGRVFCGTCGAKLDLSRMTSATVQESVKVNWFVLHWPKFAIGLGVLVLLIGSLSLWPKTELFGEKGTSVGATRLGGTVRALERISPGKPYSATFPEKDINAYFEFAKQKSLNDVFSFSVDLQEGFLKVRVVRPLAKINLMGYNLAPKVSYDLTLVPFNGMLLPREVSMGHLRIVGPLRGMIVRKVHGLVSGDKDWAVFKHTTDLKISGKAKTVTVTLKR